MWGRIKQRVHSRDADAGGEVLGYSDGGFKIIIDALMQRLQGVDLRLSARVSSLKNENGQVVVTTRVWPGALQHVLATVPSSVFAKLIAGCEGNDAAYFNRLQSIDYLDTCVQLFATPQKVTPYISTTSIRPTRRLWSFLA